MDERRTPKLIDILALIFSMLSSGILIGALDGGSRHLFISFNEPTIFLLSSFKAGVINVQF